MRKPADGDAIRAVLARLSRSPIDVRDLPDDCREGFIAAGAMGLLQARPLAVEMARRIVARQAGRTYDPDAPDKDDGKAWLLGELWRTKGGKVHMTGAGAEWLARETHATGGTLAEGTPAAEAECEGAEPSDGPAIPPRFQKAWQQYQQARKLLGGDPTDRECYEALEKAHEHEGTGDELPRFATWSKYVRDYRRLTHQQRNRPRAGRTSRNVVSRDAL